MLWLIAGIIIGYVLSIYTWPTLKAKLPSL